MNEYLVNLEIVGGLSVEKIITAKNKDQAVEILKATCKENGITVLRVSYCDFMG